MQVDAVQGGDLPAARLVDLREARSGDHRVSVTVECAARCPPGTGHSSDETDSDVLIGRSERGPGTARGGGRPDGGAGEGSFRWVRTAGLGLASGREERGALRRCAFDTYNEHRAS
ncbi:hypothetical protein GCM10015535_23770 [Streptomyces gelaticus]|uniref:Uncharacterized protein n=1 Tax=Streptomyces gelaticus TaxID=285446 RepID=A0ABQ2VWF9_9ACTN|nr:hypothetical protein GCM10015535_23770 [Streptomyces gelaticus]